MVDDKYTDLIAKYLSGNIASRDKRALMAWVEQDLANRMFFDSMLEVWNEAGEYEEELDLDTEKAWANLNAVLDHQEAQIGGGIDKGTKVVRIPASYRWLRAAAAVLLLMMAGYWWMNTFRSGTNRCPGTKTNR